MAQLIDIRKVTITSRTLAAEVCIADEAPLFTGNDPEGTDRIVDLMPQIADHTCYGDGGATFGEVLGDTELAHLLEHVTVELLARTNLAGDIASGQTRTIDDIDRLYEVRFACPDDVLVAGALSSACWVIDWAYTGGGDPEPDIDAIASGLVGLVQSLDGTAEAAPAAEEPEEAFDPDATIIGGPFVEEAAAPEAGEEPELSAEEPAEDVQPELPVEEQAEDEPEEEDPWAGEDMPAPQFVR